METTEPQQSKSSLKKAEKHAAKEERREATRAAMQAQQEAAKAIVERTVHSFDDESSAFGYLPILWSAEAFPLKRRRAFKKVGELDETAVNQCVWVRGRLQDCRIQGKFAFVTLRNSFETVQVLVDGTNESQMTKEALKWIGSVPAESIIDVLGKIVIPEVPVKATTVKVEMHAQRIYCISKSAPELPFQLKDANRNARDSKKTDEETVTVGQDVRLDHRVLDLRSQASQAIFQIQSVVCFLFREYLIKNGFMEIHSPKLIGGMSEGGANAFTLKYFGRDACLAQSPQLYKQMAVSGDMHRVFEIAPVFRAENSNTHRHLTEFVGFDFEMALEESWHEILDVVDGLFKYIVKGLEEKCRKQIDVVKDQFDVDDFVLCEDTPRLTYLEGARMLRESGVEGIPDNIASYDLSTEHEKKLGQLVKAKYGTDFFIMTRFPTDLRAFYSMPDPADPVWSNTYDAYFRGEEIVSGAQRIHCPKLLAERATAHGINVATIQSYIDSFKLGTYPHGGAGIGLERVVMLFLGIGNIRKVSLFPRDPKRLTP